MNLWFAGLDNPMQQQRITELVSGYIWLFPAWCERLRVELVGDLDPDCVAIVTLDEPYRSAVLALHPQFFSQADAVQHEIILHELAHCWLARITEWVRDRLLSGEDELTQERGREFQDRVESTVQGLAFSLARINGQQAQEQG